MFIYSSEILNSEFICFDLKLPETNLKLDFKSQIQKENVFRSHLTVIFQI